jgi:hypothetical protein
VLFGKFTSKVFSIKLILFIKMMEEKLKIDKISKGTVIDHIDAGYALTILNLTGLDESTRCSRFQYFHQMLQFH